MSAFDRTLKETAPARPPAGTAGRWLLDAGLLSPAGWSATWGLGFAALAAIGLIGTGSWILFWGLLLAAAPGALSVAWRPTGGGRVLVLALWALAAAGACLHFGGASGSMLLVALAPGVAGLALGAWRPGMILAAAALLATGLATVAGMAVLRPADGVTAVIAIAATGVMAASTVQAALVRREAGVAYARPGKAVAAPLAVEPAAASSAVREELDAARHAVAQAEAERDAARSESAAKSRFLANMSHELRTPLNAIIGFSDIMRTKLFGPLPERYGEYAEMIHESGQHLTDLINDILDMSKLEADRYVLHREVFDAREPAASALKLLRLQADDVGVHLRGDLPSEPLRVDADRRALKQIVLNLVSNALKFTPPEGRVYVTLQTLDGALELVVADTGVGIAAEDLARLGTPYEQTDAGRQAQGTGLGLSLVKALTALHGGEFSLESRLGEGSAATVRLPVLVADAPAEPAAQAGPV